MCAIILRQLLWKKTVLARLGSEGQILAPVSFMLFCSQNQGFTKVGMVLKIKIIHLDTGKWD